MTEAEVQKLREGGISDAIILEMQKDESTAQGQAAPTATTSSELPEVDPNTPSRVYTQARTNATPTEGQGATFTQGLMEAAPAIGGAAVAAAPYAAGALGLYGGSKLLGAAKTAADAYKTGVATQASTQEMRVLERLARGTGPEAQQARQALNELMQKTSGLRPVVPTAPAMAPGVPSAPVSGPVAPAGVPSAPAAPVARAAEQGVMNRAKQVVQQLALSKLAPMAAGLAKGANIAGMATYSGDLGPKTPQAGRMRGMEINPLTGAPWTPEQIAQYEANPAQYDAQIAPPQFRR